MSESIEMPKYENLKITKEAKDLLYEHKNRGETYSKVITKLAKKWEFVWAKWEEHLIEEDVLAGECDCNLCKVMCNTAPVF